MAEKEKWYHCDGKGNVKEIAVEPNTYIQGYSFMYSDNQRIAGMTPIFLYMRLTGAYSITDFQKVIKNGELNPAQKAVKENISLAPLLLDLFDLFQHESYDKLYKSVKAGKFNPALTEILERQPAVEYNALNDLLDARNFSEIVLQAVKNGKLDFTKFNDTDDPAPDWFLKYRLSPVPVPGYFGRVSNLGKLTSNDVTQINDRKAQVKKELKEIIANTLKAGTKPEILLLLADDVKERYNKLKDIQDTSSYHSIFPFKNPRSAGFVVDISAEQIFDLRPHYMELQESLTPGAEPLKEFYYAVRRYTTDALKKDKPATERTPENLFENTPFLMMRNSRESNAIASVSGSMLQIAVQQELALTDEKGNQLYNYTANAPMKSGEVIISVKETPKGGALRPSTEKLHILFDTLFTKSGYTEFVFPIDAYMELCKRTPGEITPEQRRKFRQKLRQDLQRMKNTKFSANLPGCKPGEIGILNAWLPAPNNCIYIKLESLYCDSLRQKNAGKMQIPTTIFKTNEQNPHLIPIMRVLCRNRTDYHNVNMEAKGGRRAHTISLKTLYEYDLALPRWEKVSKSGRHYDRDIIKPLFNAIRELNDENYIKSKYIDRDGIEHTEAEMKTAGIVDILDPEKWLLDYEIVGFKDDPEMIKSAMERAKQRDEKRIQDAVKKITKAKKKKQ